jgi:hypothetical protein
MEKSSGLLLQNFNKIGRHRPIIAGTGYDVRLAFQLDWGRTTPACDVPHPERSVVMSSRPNASSCDTAIAAIASASDPQF